MRTSLSRTTGRGVPAGTSSGIASGDPVPVPDTAGLSACPKINPADKKIKTTAEGKGRTGFILSLDLRSAAAKTLESARPGTSAETFWRQCVSLGMQHLDVLLHGGAGLPRASSAAGSARREHNRQDTAERNHGQLLGGGGGGGSVADAAGLGAGRSAK